MKNFTKNTMMIATLLGLNASFATADINAYAFDKKTEGAVLHSEYKEGDFNPYWFEESAAVSYAYDAPENTPVHRAYAEGDLNPYWFEESATAAYAYDAPENTPLHRAYAEGDFNPYWFEECTPAAYACGKVSEENTACTEV